MLIKAFCDQTQVQEHSIEAPDVSLKDQKYEGVAYYEFYK